MRQLVRRLAIPVPCVYNANKKVTEHMAIEFTVNDLKHKIEAKFSPAFLPEAKKPYNLKAVHQPELDIHGIASKAEIYNIVTSPRVIEEGLSAAIKLIYYLAADGYRIKTPLFNLKTHLPGEYDGIEDSLGEGAFPEPKFQTSAAFRKYLRKNVRVEFCGTDRPEGIIGSARDEATGLIDEAATIGGFITIRGLALKIEADAARRDESGLYFDDGHTAPIKAEMLAINQPRTLKAIVPAGLSPGAAYTLLVRTQGSAKGHGTLLKETREIRSDFTLTAYE